MNIMRICLEFPILFQNMIRYFVQSTLLERWKMQGRSQSMTSTFSSRKCLRRAKRGGVILCSMNFPICGLEIWWLWNGGMIYGWMKVSLISFPMFACSTLNQASFKEWMCGTYFFKIKSGATLRTKSQPHTR